MTTTIPPAQQDAAPLAWGTATLEDVWVRSDQAGVSACSILRALKQVGIGDAQLIN